MTQFPFEEDLFACKTYFLSLSLSLPLGCLQLCQDLKWEFFKNGTDVCSPKAKGDTYGYTGKVYVDIKLRSYVDIYLPWLCLPTGQLR